ncbi:hydroxymethylpyrimidine/phosphomethylpyrimidine kinase [Oxalobacteraceae bacterium A2-2]
MQNQTSPLILSFGAADPLGATGIQADLATIAALGGAGLTVTTALLISDTSSIEDVQAVDADWVSDQARVLLEDATVAAFKVGALSSAEQAAAVAEVLSDYPDAPLVLDPFSSRLPDSEDEDEAEEMRSALVQLLVPQATLLMLSQVELGRLAETWREAGEPEDGWETDVAHLLSLGCEYVLVTGTAAVSGANGQRRANTLFGPDGLVAQDSWQHLPGSYIGAGGTLSAAIAALMARGAEVEAAVRSAQEYTIGALAHAQRYGMGKLVPNRFFQLLPAGAAQ